MSVRLTVAFLAFSMAVGANAQTVPLLTEDFKLTPSDGPALGDGFGWSVGISGDVIVVGALVDSSPNHFGSAYVFQRAGTGWVEQQKILPSERFFGERIGSAVAIDGTWIVIGAPGSGGYLPDPARAVVFRFNGSTWEEEAVLVPSGSFVGDFFGRSVAISGDRIAVGAPGSFGSVNSAYVFHREGTTWIEEAVLVGEDTVDGDRFAGAIAIEADIVVVGALDDDDAGSAPGSAYVFRRSGLDWTQEAKLVASSPGPGQAFGGSVSIQDGQIAVGRNGAVHVFEHNGATWQENAVVSGSEIGVGRPTALYMDSLVAAAPYDDTAGAASGVAFLLKRYGSDWFRIHELAPSVRGAGQFFGWSVAIDANTAVIGSNGADTAYVYSIPQEIPTVSQWGALLMGLLMLCAASVLLRRGPQASFSNRSRATFVSGVLFVSACVANAEGPNFSVPHHPERLILRFKDTVSPQSKQNIHASFGTVQLKSYRHVSGLVLVSAPPAQLEAVAAQYNSHPDVLYAEPCYTVYGTAPPNDQHFPQLWGLENDGQPVAGQTGFPGADINALKAWENWKGDPEFRIAVVDSGIDYNHPDLKGPSWAEGNIWTNMAELNGTSGFDDDDNGYVDDIHGYNFIDSYPTVDPMDDHNPGHGTHVAGTIGAIGNNTIGVTGVNWQCKLVALKFLNSNNQGDICDAVAAMDYIIDNNIKVSNHSWGGLPGADCESRSLFDVFEEARTQIDHIAIVAAGNDNENNDFYNQIPCSLPLDNIICVAATDSKDKRMGVSSTFASNWGKHTVDLAAPGELIYSTVKSAEYEYLIGTSMASPHVAGVAALIRSRQPSWTYDIVRDRILRTVRPSLPGSDPWTTLYQTVTGGVLDAGAAVWDCDNNGIADELDIANCTGQDWCDDCNGNMLPDGCEPDCNTNSITDDCDITAGASQDCNSNRVPDECEPNEDCNGNTVQDICDIAAGTSTDCDLNDVPDECEPDCNDNGILDTCDIRDGRSDDCNQNGIPDDCNLPSETEPDCNHNNIQDRCEILVGTADDCNSNGRPDECDNTCGGGNTCDGIDGSYNCNNNAIPDECEISEFSTAPDGPFFCPVAPHPPPPTYECDDDCNNNGIPDECDITTGTSEDCNTNNIPDDCYTEEDDCDEDGTPDSCVIANCAPIPVDSACGDCDGNGVPNACDPDCDGGGGYDSCDILVGIFDDLDGNGVPDDCQELLLVPSEAYPKIQWAIDVAPPGSTVLVAPGVYSGEYNKDLDTNGKVLNVKCEVPGRCTIDCEDSGRGFHIHNLEGRNTIIDGFKIINGNVGGNGGGINCESPAGPTIRNCVMSNNDAILGGIGGGIFAGGQPLIVNCLITGNSAKIGGGIRSEAAEIINCTITNNSAQGIGDGGGVKVASSDTRIANSIVWGNTPDNLDGFNVNVSYSDIQGGYAGVGNIDVDPQFLDSSADFHFLPGSPCGDSGDNGAVPAGMSIDLDGNNRFVGAVDMGAFEYDDPDCNSNGTPDICDMTCIGTCNVTNCGLSSNCNSNGVPDECDTDCNLNGIPDDCDLSDQTSTDCQANVVPDECDLDATDPDGNGLVSADCNSNDVPDECEPDCNGNNVADECDITTGTSQDCDVNGVPDECETTAACCLVNFFGMGYCLETTQCDCLQRGGAFSSGQSCAQVYCAGTNGPVQWP